MTKPVIVTRQVKGAPLTRAELDANFSNIDDATIGVSDGTNSGSLSLNDTLTFAATGSATVAYNNSTKTVTVGATAGSSGGNNIIIIGSAGSDPGTLSFNTDSFGTRPTDSFRLISSGGVSGVSVSSNTFTLPAGTYIIELPWVITSGTPFRLTKGGSYNFASRVNDDFNNSVIQTSAGGAIGGAGNSLISPGATSQFTLTGSTSLSFYKNGNIGNDYMSVLDRSNMGHTAIMFKFIKVA